MDAEAMRASSLFSAIMSTTDSGGSKELLRIIRSHTLVSIELFLDDPHLVDKIRATFPRHVPPHNSAPEQSQVRSYGRSPRMRIEDWELSIGQI